MSINCKRLLKTAILTYLLSPFFYILYLHLHHLHQKPDPHNHPLRKYHYAPQNHLLNFHFHNTRLISKFSCHIAPLKILILVSTHIRNTQQRTLVRRTWGLRSPIHTYSDYKIFFVSGVLESEREMNPIFKEGIQYRDIIFVNVTDSEEDEGEGGGGERGGGGGGVGDTAGVGRMNKMNAMLEYAYKHCVYEYLVTLNDDIFLNLSNMIALLHQPDVPVSNLYMGWVKKRNEETNDGDLEEEAANQFNGQRHLLFCDGGAIVFSNDLVKKLVPYLRNASVVDYRTDEYVGVLVFNTGATPTHNPSFRFHHDSDDCTYDNEAVALLSRNCMETMFVSMVMRNHKDPFIALHYGMTGLIGKRRHSEPFSVQ